MNPSEYETANGTWFLVVVGELFVSFKISGACGTAVGNTSPSQGLIAIETLKVPVSSRQ